MPVAHPPRRRRRTWLAIAVVCLLALSILATRSLRAPRAVPVMPPGVSAHHVVPYKDVAWQHDGDGLVVESATPPAGLYFRYELDPARRYLVQSRGETLHGLPVFRVRKDGGVPEYQVVPEGERTSVVSGIRRLELLVYADEPFGYRLDALSVDECDACETDADLKAEILAANPGLEVLLDERPLDAAREILRWISPRIDFALTPAAVEMGDRAVGAASAADAYYRLFSTSDQSGVFCGGASVFASRVLALFGFEAAPINFGIPGTDLTHVAVVIAHHDGARRRFYLVDPTFNATFHVAADGRLASLGDLIQAWRSDGFDTIRVTEAPLDERKWIFIGDAAALDRTHLTACEPEDGPGEVLGCHLPAFNLAYYTESFGEALEAAGLHRDARAYVQLLEAGVFTFGPFATHEATAALIDRLRVLDVPYRGAHPRRLDRLRSALGSLF